MKSVLTSAAWIGLAVSTGGVPLFAQLQNNSEKQLTCSNGGNDRDRARFARSANRVCLRSGALTSMRARTGRNRERLAAGRCAGSRARGGFGRDRRRRGESGEPRDGRWLRRTGASHGTGDLEQLVWSVSYEIFVPQVTDVTLKTRNGGLNDLRCARPDPLRCGKRRCASEDGLAARSPARPSMAGSTSN